jgi:polyhydroxyalkanoate synthesis regulator phasin
MKRQSLKGIAILAGYIGLAVSGVAQTPAAAPSADALLRKLVEKGVLTDQEAKDILSESTQTNLSTSAASKWRISNAIKNIELYGDLRFRYEYREAANAPGGGSFNAAGAPTEDYMRERERMALRVGIRGDLYDDFYYGLRLETANNPRSPWVTFGEGGTQGNPAPFAKDKFGMYLGQAYLGWRPFDWIEVTLGKMPMPLYTTPMVWDSDFSPEGAVEKLKFSAGPYVDLFANFGQFVYQAYEPGLQVPTSDAFLLAWQLGTTVHLTKDISLKAAPVLYNYTGYGQTNLLNQTFTGEGYQGVNVGLYTNYATALHFNQNGLNNLLVLEVPAELNFTVGKYGARVFGDFAYNFDGNQRAEAAAQAAGPAILSHAYLGQDKAYQVGVGFGNLGLVYGATSKKNTWEARAYFQHIEQYAEDVNMIDSDFFEGRANLEGCYVALAYSITDGIIATVRYGYANRINKELGTGGNNQDLPILNPIQNYHLVQLDVTWRF